MIKHVVVPSTSAPKGWKCEVCKLSMLPGQNACYMKKMKYNTAINICWHDQCMVELLATVPSITGAEAKLAKMKAEEEALKLRFEDLKKKYESYTG